MGNKIMNSRTLAASFDSLLHAATIAQVQFDVVDLATALDGTVRVDFDDTGEQFGLPVIFRFSFRDESSAVYQEE